MPLSSAPASPFLATSQGLASRHVARNPLGPGCPSWSPVPLQSFDRVLPLFLRPRISTWLPDSYLLKVWRPYRGFPPPRRYSLLQAFLTTTSFLRTSWLSAVREFPLVSIAAPDSGPLTSFPFWDFYPSEISPFDQLSPSRVSCSLAFSQGCEALLRSKVPGRNFDK
jgi:hypothetical protein